MQQPSFIKKFINKGYQLIETHIDYILVGRRFVYKIKKPVKFSFVDYSTLAKRKKFCQEEIRLNRRYAPDLYLGVVPILETEKIVEYAVKMKALPENNRLDKLLHANKVSEAMVQEIAAVLWSFHRQAKTSPAIQQYATPAYLKQRFMDDFKNIHHFTGKTIAKTALANLSHFLNSFLKNQQALFIRRMKTERIRDLHGDLHTENIFYVKKPYIFDCVEFNASLRYVDIAAEISFLLMDLEFRGRKDLARIFLAVYLVKSQDFEILKLVNFYQCHYAVVKGLVHCLDGKFVLARKYFLLAQSYTKQQPWLVAIGGIIGTGKSTLAGKIAKQCGYPVLSSDVIRKKLAGIPLYSHPKDDFRKGLYSPLFTKKTYAEMFKQAVKLLKTGQSVILDASFSKRAQRRPLKKLADNAHLLFIEMPFDRRTVLARLKNRRHTASDATVKILAEFAKNYAMNALSSHLKT